MEAVTLTKVKSVIVVKRVAVVEMVWVVHDIEGQCVDSICG
jgi:hypothetical protein